MNFISISRGHTGAVDALLASYAAGALSRPLHALVASHLALKSDNRAFVSSMEALLANEMEETKGQELHNRSARLAAIFNAVPDGNNRNEVEGSSFVPAPLSTYFGTSYEELPWRTVMPGLREVQFEHAPGCEASMLWIKAGRAMPSHTHPGVEATLVLKGSFSDITGHYGRGDMAVVDSDVDHKPIAGNDEDCICFAVSEGPVKLTGPIARLFQKLIRH